MLDFKGEWEKGGVQVQLLLVPRARLCIRARPESHSAPPEGAQDGPGHCRKGGIKETPGHARSKMPNPKTRSSGLQHIALFAKKTPATPSPPVPRTSSLTPPVSPCTPGTSKQSPCTPSTSLTGFHRGGSLLDGLYSHLAGGNRGEHSARQITRYVGKYLFHLNPDLVEEGGLLDTDSVSPYLDQTQRAGIGSSGILHRILAHQAAVNFMRLGVSYLWWCEILYRSPLPEDGGGLPAEKS